MFKNATIYRITLPEGAALADIDERMAAAPFVPCTPSQSFSAGWVPPRGEEHGAMVESVGGQWVARLMTESKAVPGEVLRRRVAEACKVIEQETGRKPGKKERKALSEDLMLELLPQAFPKQTAVAVWIDPAAGLLVLDTSSQDMANIVVTAIVEVVDGVTIGGLCTELSPVAVMSSWLLDGDKLSTEDRFSFDICRACELKSMDEAAAVVRYKNHSLDIQEIRDHITQGKVAVKLALCYSDRVDFTLTDRLVLSGLDFLDVVFEGAGPDDSGFDADVAILTGELSKLIADLVEALGGEAKPGQVAA